MITGLTYREDFITRCEEEALLDSIDAAEWQDDLKRRVQHYGYRYDYKARRVDASMFLGELPRWAEGVADRLRVHGLVANQLIVNEYLPGQGISAHVDCVPCFGNIVASVSLGSACVMTLDRIGRVDSVHLPLAQRSLLLLDGPARFFWRHGIAARKTDIIRGQKFRRSRRVSLTFRRVLERRIVQEPAQAAESKR